MDGTLVRLLGGRQIESNHRKIRDEQSNAPANALTRNGLPVSSKTSSVEETYELLSDAEILYR